MTNRLLKYLIPTAIIVFYLATTFGYWRSKIEGMPYGITLIDRQKLGIPEIPTSWNRFPKKDPLSATQIWINTGTVAPNHYAKLIMLPDLGKSKYKTLGLEVDRYVLESTPTEQTDLVIKVIYDDSNEGILNRYCTIDWMKRQTLDDYMYNLTQDRAPLRSLTYEDALTLLKEKGLR
jgi:hypothetical protein